MVSISTTKGSEKSKQDQGTPWEFIRAVEARYGPIAFDLAASAHNKKHERYFSLPGDPKAEAHDSLFQPWHKLCATVDQGSILWLNPEFKHIAPWAKKCLEESAKLSRGVRIGFLTPASVGSNWYRDFVFKKAWTNFLNGRIIFDGDVQPYPKDLMLTLFGWAGMQVGVDVWTWKNETWRKET